MEEIDRLEGGLPQEEKSGLGGGPERASGRIASGSQGRESSAGGETRIESLKLVCRQKGYTRVPLGLSGCEIRLYLLTTMLALTLVLK